jgi:hypothetical protein
VNSIPKINKQYDIKMIVILQDFTKFIAETLNSFFSKLVNNEIRLYRTQPTISVFFVIGEPHENKKHIDLESEALEYKDIIQFGFKDSYYNLTLKQIALIRWAYQKCPKDDMRLYYVCTHSKCTHKWTE